MHPDQLALTEPTVRLLVAEQFPEWEHLLVQAVPTAGTDNAIFRIGDELAARFPLRAQDPATTQALLAAEAAAARELAEASTVPTPEPVATGEPGHGCPLPWSVQTWLPGQTATLEDPAGSIDFAADLAGFIAHLRASDTRGRKVTGERRGGHLEHHDAWMGGAWHLLDEAPRPRLHDALACGQIQWRRGMAWAFAQAMGLVWYYAESNPSMSRLGRRTLTRLINSATGQGPPGSDAASRW